MAKAFIFASEDEDFGILLVEAMSAGLPIIAYYSGGVKETIVDKKTGIFFTELTEERLEKALQEFDKISWNTKEIREHAQAYRKERFEKELSHLLQSLNLL